MNPTLKRKLGGVFLLGFSAGVPYCLTNSTLQAWMKSESVDLTVIGLFSLVGLPASFKFLWAPILDRFSWPFLGRRRGWLLVSQMGLALALVAMAFAQPKEHLAQLAALVLVVSIFDCMQNMLVDGYNAEILLARERGTGEAFYVTGFRIAMILTGAVALILADHLSWNHVYLLMSCGLAFGVVGTLVAPEPAPAEGRPTSLKEAVVLPALEFFRRGCSWEILAFILFYRLDVIVASTMATPFMLDLGFSGTEIGTVLKGFGVAATIGGAFLGGTLIARQGLKRCLWIFGVGQGVAAIAYALLAHAGHSFPALVVAVAVENLCSGMGTAAFVSFLMSLCDPRFAVTQSALFSSVMGLSATLAGAPSGFLAKALGWKAYFLVSILFAIPGLALLTRYDRWKLRV